MKISSEQEMLDFGRRFAMQLKKPCVIELIGDVGAGKTTFVRGLAEGLGVTEPVTSPSFTISKSYVFADGILIHYDFYRLPDPGLMQDDLEESIITPNAVVVVEWADSVEQILPQDCIRIQIAYNEDNTRDVLVASSDDDIM